MELNYYKRNEENDILKLKEDLMSKGKTSTASTSRASQDINNLISEEVRQIINEGTGKAFEENIRGVLSHKFNF